MSDIAWRGVVTAGARLALRGAWLSIMIITPLLGVWLSSSLAAYHNRSIGLCLAVGLLMFPVLPLAWDGLSRRRVRRNPERRQVLTRLDRLVLRTLAINGALVATVLWLAPAPAFRALSTRGDWPLDGHHGALASAIRGQIFGLTDLLADSYQARAETPFGASDTPPEFGAHPPAAASAHWPGDPVLHPAARRVPAALETDYRRVAAHLRGQLADPFELTRALHDYVVRRLEYDHDGLARAKAGDAARPAQDPDSVFAARRAVCEGYARLLAAMGEVAGIEIAYVTGKARRGSIRSDGAPHAWNAARIDGAWHLIDATWNDDGTARDGTHRFETTYLFTPPPLFGLDHLPDDPRWQLRAEPLSPGAFMRQPGIGPRFSLLDLELRAPTRSQVTVSGRIDVIIANPRGAHLGATWHDGEEGGPCEVRRASVSRITCRLPGDGQYVVEIFGSRERRGTYDHLAHLLVNSR